MVEILCPHCDEEIELDDGAVGEFTCPLCDEDFTWEGGLDDGDRKSFWIAFGTPNVLIIMAWALGIFLDGDDVIGLFHIVSLLSWIAILIHGIRTDNKSMWKGALAGLAAAPAVVIIGAVWYIEATDWSVF